jgi:outer membrane receptor protein involved in Fe transport
VKFKSFKNLESTLGLRLENNSQRLQSKERGSGTSISVNNTIKNLLPSANFTYTVSSKQQLKAGIGKTVNRPEFRELAPFTYYDFNFDVARIGNKNLKNAEIMNYDLRYELYPNSGEMISLGAFYKSFKNPIEQAIFYNGSTVAFTVENAKEAMTTGVELEIRKNIKGIANDKLSTYFNASYIHSNVKVSGLNDSGRYLQGQSPYLFNAGVFYTDSPNGLNASIMYNVIGKRIFVIGDNVLSANVFEMPRNVVDLTVSKKLTQKLECKANVQDIFNQATRLVQDTDRNNKITSTDGVYQEFKRGTTSTLSFTYKF